jgi:hypothetical protein
MMDFYFIFFGGHFSMMKVLCELHHLELALAPKGLDFEMTDKTNNISALYLA